jgi:putative PEP-CTERM system histidine kinase
MLLSALLFSGWLMMCYDVINYRLLNRRIFISRKIIYSFIFPTLLAIYFISFGIIALVMSIFGVELFFVVKWLLFTFGIVGVVLFGFSGKIRRRGHFFISTHFFTNKYEFRDEWLSLSEQLQGAKTELEVVQALNHVLTESLYTAEIFIWLGDSEKTRDFKLVSWHKDYTNNDFPAIISTKSPLINYLKQQSYFHLDEKERSPQWEEVRQHQETLVEALSLNLIAPISIHNHISGLIGLGSEYTGSKYSYDDFDLLSALGSQSASTLLAIRTSEELAATREQQAWNRLSAFVLHDIKNAATMLSLLQENAPEHIHEPEFQEDMLELVDDTLKRMKRVEQRLGTLKEEVKPDLQAVKLQPFLLKSTERIIKKIPSLHVQVEVANNLIIHSDPDILSSIVENLLLNASQAQTGKTVVTIKADRDNLSDIIILEISDNGPGISENLLPEALFEPFKTTKKSGSGIGLWQVKRQVTSIGGIITANNTPDSGALFTLILPGDSVE